MSAEYDIDKDPVIITWQSALLRKLDRGWDDWRCYRYADKKATKTRLRLEKEMTGKA